MTTLIDPKAVEEAIVARLASVLSVPVDGYPDDWQQYADTVASSGSGAAVVGIYRARPESEQEGGVGFVYAVRVTLAMPSVAGADDHRAIYPAWLAIISATHSWQATIDSEPVICEVTDAGFLGYRDGLYAYFVDLDCKPLLTVR